MRLAAAVSLLVGASAGHWSIVSNTSVGQQSFGLSFWNKNQGIVAAQTAGGLVYEVFGTSDGGLTWGDDETSLIALTDSAATSNNGIVCGGWGIQYTTNFGANWTGSSTGLSASSCTTARTLGYGTAGFAVVGMLGIAGNPGCGISTDGGVTWTAYDTTSVSTVAPVYGAFPTPTAWYLSAGGQSCSSGVGCYIGQLIKSSDGGKTWVDTFPSLPSGTMLLGIDCSDANTCSVGAVDNSNTIYIYATRDGGSTWSATFNLTSAAQTFINDIRVVGSDWWAIGGTFQETGWVLHSADGVTWTIDTTFPGAYGTGLDVSGDGAAVFGLLFETSQSDDGNNNYLIKYSSSGAAA